MNKDTEQYIEHEVRLRLHEGLYKHLYDKLESMDKKIDSNFHWTLTLIISSIIIPFLMHKFNIA